MNGLAKKDQPTAKQENFIRLLLGSVVPTDLDRLPLVDRERDRIKAIISDFRHGETITYNEGRDLISTLIAARDAQPKPERKNAAPGYYVRHTEGDFIVVVENRAKTNTYAKRLNVTKTANGRTKARWEYVPGLGFQVADLSPMTLAEAAAFGHLHGVCFVCCKQLTDPESVKRGIGPVCAKKFR